MYLFYNDNIITLLYQYYCFVPANAIYLCNSAEETMDFIRKEEARANAEFERAIKEDEKKRSELIAKKDKGKTSGSRVMFIHDERKPILLHKPHPRKELLEYQLKQLLDVLEQEGLL